jgi:hypothetical protein
MTPLLTGYLLGLFTFPFLGLVAVSVTEWRRSRNPWAGVEKRGQP